MKPTRIFFNKSKLNPDWETILPAKDAQKRPILDEHGQPVMHTYVSLLAWNLNNPKENGHTALVKQEAPRELNLDSRDIPIIGSLTDPERRPGNQTRPAHGGYPTAAPSRPATPASTTTTKPKDDVPF